VVWLHTRFPHGCSYLVAGYSLYDFLVHVVAATPKHGGPYAAVGSWQLPLGFGWFPVVPIWFPRFNVVAPAVIG